MELYTFTPTAVVIHWYIRLHSWLTAMRDRRVLCKQFKTTLHLEKLQKENLSFELPKSYPVATNEITYLYNIRDRILSKIHENDYVTKQTAIDNRIDVLKTEYDALKKHRISKKHDLDRIHAKQKNPNLTPDDSIALESSFATASTALDNTDTAIKNCKDQTDRLVRTKKSNVKNWQKQIDELEKVIENAIGRYVKNATRKIELSYGFTNYTHPVGKYSDRVQSFLNGEY